MHRAHSSGGRWFIVCVNTRKMHGAVSNSGDKLINLNIIIELSYTINVCAFYSPKKEITGTKRPYGAFSLLFQGIHDPKCEISFISVYTITIISIRLWIVSPKLNLEQAQKGRTF